MPTKKKKFIPQTFTILWTEHVNGSRPRTRKSSLETGKKKKYVKNNFFGMLLLFESKWDRTMTMGPEKKNKIKKMVLETQTADVLLLLPGRWLGFDERSAWQTSLFGVVQVSDRSPGAKSRRQAQAATLRWLQVEVTESSASWIPPSPSVSRNLCSDEK